ncbi:SDR family oxidoreductase [Actinomadura barringtoniae]|uniref:SDR family oxidoreductase n=1 Tax=Actinomadura barringtoniae TaxID=1427535 RepID=A0A939P7R4_9ACTN|nr:SDR family NAD(P)-dependent oxidoreductase [Actinomadura barringtoniae]MBO2447387.1 SDR family oxidoreductase [Actinomadura barringtoniae]
MSGEFKDLAGKVVVITGGSRGLGAQTAREFAGQGAKVCVVGRDAEALDGVVAGIVKDGGTAIAVTADATDSGALAWVRERTETELGPVDVLCAFAGGQGFPVPSLELTEERWREVIDADLTSAFLTVSTFLPGMAERGAGSIILMSSASGRQPSRANLAYGAANAGLVMMARHLANEIGPKGVRVNCIAPSAILTEKVDQMMPGEIKKQVAADHPLGRIGTTHDIAQTAMFLASDASGYLTGLTLDVAGGRITN